MFRSSLWDYTDRMEGAQLPLFCRCGSTGPFYSRGLCARCYWQLRNDIRNFDGRREQTLRRDRRRCVICSSDEDPIVHHRPRGLATLCRPHHAKIHHLAALYFASEIMVELWTELHPNKPQQLQLEFM